MHIVGIAAACAAAACVCASAVEFEPPLLPDGAMLSRAAGSVEFDSELRTWAFVMEGTLEGEGRRHLVLLPGEVLHAMLQHRAKGGASQRFEVSGHLTSDGNRNYLLVQHALPRAQPLPPPVAPVRPVPAPAPAKATAVATAPLPSGALTAPPVDAENFARELERRLANRVGEVPTTSDAAHATPAPSEPFAPPVVVPPSATEPTPAVAAVTAGLQRRILDRRATITRDPQDGAWRANFGTGWGSSLGESYELLPCALLNRLASAAGGLPPGAPVLLSGTVTTYEGRQYLLPTTARALRHGLYVGP